MSEKKWWCERDGVSSARDPDEHISRLKVKACQQPKLLYNNRLN